ncbi:ribosomal-protein-alanine N-acetyltransferase [Cytobacillus eiseniae]|uniref:Ribosomal-protein-alanine N-acetyltransferase n=1 Tax=Cytobacillus eiseniae TaxID=762947 RepID=A0ABS4RHC2_9BACI|nr:GNAT family N-acetyltransferase [Cytobacillus eiseniae]MBP2242304.1 ribosomal-protein-alanine N-acetyltransferase [Cytobacillus eiseniae]
MKVTLEKLQQADAIKLYEFELENRDYFEKMVPGRGEEYYNLKTFKIRNEALLDEQAKGLSYYYLIKNEKGLILGRMNLVDIDKSRQLAYIGYRVGEAYTGKGIANLVLRLLLSTISEQGIEQILAKTTTNNLASQKVLEKNGFKHVSTDEEDFEMNGNRLKFVYYKWNN